MDVSVIIAVYNTEKYLPGCIDSVLQQEKVSLEVILVDDGSNDSSPRICDDYANRYENVKVIHQKNAGPGTARNEGQKIARGNYVTFTDSDDKMEKQMLCKMVSKGYETDADIVCCNYKEIDENGHVSNRDYTNKTYILNHEEGLVHFYSKDKIYSQCWTKLYKRNMLLAHHVENELLRFDEDIIYNIRAFKYAQVTVIVDEPLYEYTIRGNSYAREYYLRSMEQYIDDRITRVQITQKAVEDESETVKEWSNVHILMYYNELLGRAAMFPCYLSDKRILGVVRYIKQNKRILDAFYKTCGFSKLGKLMILYMPSHLYMKYRHSKAISL